MTIIDTTFVASDNPTTTNVVALCDTCNELALNPAIDHAWDENDMYIGTITCEDCNNAA